jgi:hypothetical protein
LLKLSSLIALLSDLGDFAGLDPLDVVNTGATELDSILPPELVGTVILAYSNALIGPFAIAAAMASFAILPALSMDWKSVKEKRETDEAT